MVENAHKDIIDNYSLDKMIHSYRKLYLQEEKSLEYSRIFPSSFTIIHKVVQLGYRSLTIDRDHSYLFVSLLAPSTYTERLTRIRVIEKRFGGRPYVLSCAYTVANMRVISKQIHSKGFTTFYSNN